MLYRWAIITFLSLNASAQTYPPLNPIDRELKAELFQQWQNQVGFFKRPVRSYHYGNRGPLNETTGNTLEFNQDEAIDLKRTSQQPTDPTSEYRTPVELNPPEALEYFKAMSGNFHRQNLRWNVGPGLYAATDPITSMSYAGDPWFLLEITIPTGAKFLDLRPGNGILLKKIYAQNYFRDSGKRWRTDDLLYLGNDLYWMELEGALKKSKTILRLFREFVKNHQVDIVIYSWKEVALPFCRDFIGGKAPAFQFVRPDMKNAQLRLYSGELEERPDPEKAKAYSFLAQILELKEIFFSLHFQNAFDVKISTFLHVQKVLPTWNQILKYGSILEKVLLFKNDSRNLLSLFDQNDVEGKINENLPGLIENTDHSIYFNPAYLAFQIHPEKYFKIYQQIQKYTFGCSSNPAHAWEREPTFSPLLPKVRGTKTR